MSVSYKELFDQIDKLVARFIAFNPAERTILPPDLYKLKILSDELRKRMWMRPLTTYVNLAHATLYAEADEPRDQPGEETRCEEVIREIMDELFAQLSVEEQEQANTAVRLKRAELGLSTDLRLVP